MRRGIRLFVVLAVSAAFLACGVEEGVLATVGEDQVTLTAFQDYLGAATGELWQAATEPVASRLLDQFLDQEILIAAAVRESAIDVPSTPEARSARVRLLVDGLCGSAPPPAEERVEERIADAQNEVRPARAHVRQMLIDSLPAAEAARAQLDAGADFVELSREVSRAPNAADGGDLGFLNEGGLPPELDEVIFALESGEFSQPVPGPSGYHIFQVLEVVPAGSPPRHEIEPEIRRRLEEIAAREHTTACVDRLAHEVGVRVIHDRLWFRYDGRYAEEIHAL
jgi:peptidyl-prolyl cis-trans isomerase C